MRDTNVYIYFKKRTFAIRGYTGFSAVYQDDASKLQFFEELFNLDHLYRNRERCMVL
jgi:hypothetical protein